MIIKIKNIARKGISLVLALAMMMPTGAFAATYNVNNWDGYKEVLVDGLMEQKGSITVDFGENEIFTTEETAHQRITNMYNEATAEVPRQYGKMNISVTKRTPKIVKISENTYRLEEVIFALEYYNNIKEITIQPDFVGKIDEIKALDKVYDKIKRAYDYILDKLEFSSSSNERDILANLNPKKAVSSHAYAILFSIIMDELGYENIIVDGTIREIPVEHMWNLVKVQGKWYHVDASLGDVGTNGDKYLLTSDDIMDENYTHDWKGDSVVSYLGDPIASDIYNSEDSLTYEIEFIKAGIVEASAELVIITNVDLKAKVSEIQSIDELKPIEDRLAIVSEKIIGFKNSIGVLKSMGINVTELENDLKGLTDLEGVIKTSIDDFKTAILKAIEAVEKAATSITQGDVAAAEVSVNILPTGNIKTNLNSRLSIVKAGVDAKKAVEAAESILSGASSENDNDVNSAVDNAVDSINREGEGANALVEALVDDIVIKTKNELLSRIAEIVKLESTKDKVLNAEDSNPATKENIDAAKSAVNQINAKYSNIKTNLENRIVQLELELKDAEKAEVIEKVNYVVEILNTVIDEVWPVEWGLGDWTLEKVRELSEAAVKTAETSVKTIKDTTVKTAQQYRIKDLKIIIAAIKAVEKAENTVPQKTTYVTAARTAINKIIKSEYDDVKQALHDRVDEVDKSLKATEAEKLLEKAEISLKRADYDKANTAVDKIADTNLTNRLADNLNVISAKEAVENAEKLMKANKSDVSIYETAVEEYTEPIIVSVPNIYIERIDKLNKRVEEMEVAIDAIKAVNTANESFNKYILSSTPENKATINEDIEDANLLVNNINVNNASLLSIKKSLVARLKVFSDKLTADGNYSTVSGLLNDIEINLKTRLEEDVDIVEKAKEIDALEKSMLSIAEHTKSINDKNNSKDLKDRTLAINNAIAAAKAVVEAEASDAISVSKKITTAAKAIEKLSNVGIYIRITDMGTLKSNLQARINELSEKVKTEIDEANAKALVEKAINSKKESDIKAAIDAVAKLEDGDFKNGLNQDIVGLVDLLISEANSRIIAAIASIQYNDKSFATKVSDAKKSVALAVNAIIAADDMLKDLTDYDKYKNEIIDLNKDIVEIDKSVTALKAVQQAEKSKTEANVIVAYTAIGNIKPKVDHDKYNDMIDALNERVEAIEEYLKGLSDNEDAAIGAVVAAEEPMQPKRVDGVPEQFDLSDFKYDAAKVQTAKTLIKNVFDNNVQKELNGRILTLETAQAAIISFNKAKVYPIEKNIKDAEAALGKVGSDYFSLVEVLNREIAKLYENLNESKSNAYKDADNAVKNATEVIKKLNEYMAGLIKTEDLPIKIEELEYSDEEGFDKDIAYGRIRVARNFLMYAEDSVQMLTNSTDIKSLTNRIKLANEQIDLADDKIDVKEAIRLVNKASESVNTAKSTKTEADKAEADYDITAAKLAIAIIEHKDNKEIKSTIIKNLNLIEKRLTSNNDKELIEVAYKLVNDAANLLIEAIADDNVNGKSGDISDAIWAANLAIVGISNDNKEAKATLINFLDEISEIFALEQETLSNEVRINNARTAVEVAEKYEGNNEDEKYALIRSARLRVGIIKNLNSDTKVIIDELNLRLDILEGKTGGGTGTGGSGGNTKPGGSNSGSNKPGGDTTPINIIPTTPLPDSKRVIGTTEPIWGKTKELKKANPTAGLSIQDMTAFRVNESKLKTIELSNMLNTTPSANATLVVRGKNIKLDSKPYINDKVNNSILLPIKFLGDELGFAVSLIDSPVANGAKRLLINGLVNGASKSIIMDLGSEYCYVNGMLVKMSSKPVIQEGRTYIPVDFMVEHLGLSFSYYNESGTIQLIIN